MKKKIVFLSIIISIIVILIASIYLYSTYATDPIESNDSYTITLTGDTSVSVPRFSYKDVIYQIKNTTDGTVNYGVGFTSNNSTTKVKTFADSTDPGTGTIARNDYKYIKLRVENYSDDIETVTLSTILGYENGGDLVVPSGVTQVTSTTDGTYTMNSAANGTYFYISTLTRSNIESIEYTKLSDMPVNQTTTNISSDNSVRLWYELNEDTNLYKVYIGSLTGKFKAPSNMSSMFSWLTHVSELDVSAIDTSSVTNMHQLFYGSSGLTDINLSSFNTEKVVSMAGMFYGCSKLKKLDLSNFYTPLLSAIKGSGESYGMFGACTALEELDLSNFNTSKVTDMRVVFYNCRSLRILKLDNWDFSNVTNYTNAFTGVPSSADITVNNCTQYNLFVTNVTKFGSKSGLHTVSGDYSCSS